MGVTTEYATHKSIPNKRAGIALVVIGTLLFIAGILLIALVNLYAGLGLLVLSVALIIVGFVYMFRKSFAEKLSVVIQTNIPSATMSYSIYSDTFTNPKSNGSVPIKIAVNLPVAEEIVDTIGALIVAKGAQSNH